MRRLETPNWQKKQAKRNGFGLALLCALLLIPLSAGGYFFAPALWDGFSGATLTASGATVFVRAGGNFQAALDRAKPGDTIVLEAGANFVGSFTLPNKPGAEFITIQSSNLAKLPADGERVGPAHAAAMPKILGPGGGEPALKTAPNAHHYRFVGIEFAPRGADYVYNLIALGSDSQKLAETPANLEFDRCFIHPNPNGKTRRGVMLNSRDTIIRNSYIAGFAYPEEETQAIAGWNGPGGYRIVNNYLEAGAENILFGGADPSIENLVPTDIEIRNNLLTKPAAWRGKAGIKCAFELKNARNVRVIGNIIENSFDEMAVRLTVRNQNGGAPWSVIEDVRLENNLIRASGGGVNILGRDDLNPSATMKRVTIVNNLFEDLDSRKFGADGLFIKISGGEDIAVANNTIFHDGNVLTAHGEASKRFVLRNNIFSHNAYGFTGDDVVGRGVFTKYLPDAAVSDNVVVNGKRVPPGDIYVPPRNSLVDGFDAVGFLDRAAGNYRLAPASKFKDKKIGCDIDALENEIGKARKK